MELSESFRVTLENWLMAFMGRSMRDSVVYAKQNGLSMTQVAALLRIHKSGCSNVSCLGEEMGISNPAASQMLERLVQMGLVIRRENPEDRRLKQIALTERGQAVLEGGMRARQQWLVEMSKLLSPEEQEQVTAAFKIMLEKETQLGPPFVP